MKPQLSEDDRQFLSALQALMREYQVSRSQLFLILDQSVHRRSVTGPTPQPLRAYRNPHTGRIIQVRTGKSLTYRAWATQYGKEVVASWLMSQDG